MGLRDRLDAFQELAQQKAAEAEARVDPAVREKRERKRNDPAGKKISEVGDRSDAGLACPKCGGTQFKAKRRGAAKLATGATLGVGALLVPKTRVKCVTCGTEYVRG